MVALLVAAGAWAWWQQSAVFDDAFISYRYARNLVAGHGLSFNPGERIEGYSNLAWVLWAAAGLRLGLDPLGTTRLLGVASYLLSIGWIAHTFLAHFVRGRPARLLALPFMAVLVVPPGLAAVAGSGLETAFAGLLLVAIALLQFPLDGRVRGPVGGQLAPGLAGLLCLTRPEGPLAVAALGIGALLTERSTGAPWPRALLAAVGCTVLPVGIVVLHTGFRLLYFGELLPNTYFAKGAEAGHLEAGLAYLTSFVVSNPVSIVLLALLAFGLARAPNEQRGVLRFAACYVALYTLYVVRVGGDFMQYRFMWQVWPLLALAASVGLGALLARKLGWGLATVAVGLPLLAADVTLEPRFHMQSIEDMRSVTRTGWLVGPTLGRVLPEDTTLSTTMIGVIGWASDLRVIDQWGLTESYVRSMTQPERFSRGHQKPAPLSYLQLRGVNLYLDHPKICQCDRPCILRDPTVLIRLPNGRCLGTWLLEPTPELVRHICEHPEHFIPRAPICMVGRGRQRVGE